MAKTKSIKVFGSERKILGNCKKKIFGSVFGKSSLQCSRGKEFCEVSLTANRHCFPMEGSLYFSRSFILVGSQATIIRRNLLIFCMAISSYNELSGIVDSSPYDYVYSGQLPFQMSQPVLA